MNSRNNQHCKASSQNATEMNNQHNRPTHLREEAAGKRPYSGATRYRFNCTTNALKVRVKEQHMRKRSWFWSSGLGFSPSKANQSLKMQCNQIFQATTNALKIRVGEPKEAKLRRGRTPMGPRVKAPVKIKL
jgi:hypothetical protein